MNIIHQKKKRSKLHQPVRYNNDKIDDLLQWEWWPSS
jgi:hypothetical protein